MSNEAYHSVSKMIDALAEGDALSAEIKQRISQRKVVKALQAMRIAKDIPQARIAAELNCSQSRVSKIENGDDCDLKFGEVEAYARALNCDVNIVFTRRDETAVERVKRCAFAIKRELDVLAECAHLDEKIASGVASFFGEAFFNLIGLLEDSSQRLPLRPDGEPYVRVTSSLDSCATDVDESDCQGEQRSAHRLHSQETPALT